jgi:hypothetical protein
MSASLKSFDFSVNNTEIMWLLPNRWLQIKGCFSGSECGGKRDEDRDRERDEDKERKKEGERACV